MNYIIDTFDWRYYIGQYIDLRNAGILTKKKAWKHWQQYGRRENRINRSIAEGKAERKKASKRITAEQKKAAKRTKAAELNRITAENTIIKTYFKNFRSIIKKPKYFKKTYVVFGYIGNVTTEVINLITQFNKINPKKHDCKLLIIDNGYETKKTLIKNVQKLIKHNNNIRYLRQLSQEDILNILDNYIDILCIPSDLENTLNTIEALVHNKILLCPNNYSLNNIIIDNVTGIFFNKNEWNDLYIKLIDILESKYNFKDIKKNLYKMISKCVKNN